MFEDLSGPKTMQFTIQNFTAVQKLEFGFTKITSLSSTKLYFNVKKRKICAQSFFFNDFLLPLEEFRSGDTNIRKSFLGLQIIYCNLR